MGAHISRENVIKWKLLNSSIDGNYFYVFFMYVKLLRTENAFRFDSNLFLTNLNEPEIEMKYIFHLQEVSFHHFERSRKSILNANQIYGQSKAEFRVNSILMFSSEFAFKRAHHRKIFNALTSKLIVCLFVCFQIPTKRLIIM